MNYHIIVFIGGVFGKERQIAKSIDLNNTLDVIFWPEAVTDI